MRFDVRHYGILVTIGVLMAFSAQAQESACGYISASSKPPISDNVFEAEIRKIDGEDLPKRAKNRYRLSAGRHVIAIQERIADNPKGYTKLRKLGNKSVPLVYKLMEIEIKPDTTYQIGAQLFPDRIDPEAPNDFWEPTVWRQTITECH